MMTKHTNPAALIAFTTAILLSGSAFCAKLAPADIRAQEKPLTTRVHEADKVFVAELVNRKLLKGDWCHADLKVTKAIKGVKLGELIPVVWRPKIASACHGAGALLSRGRSYGAALVVMGSS